MKKITNDKTGPLMAQFSSLLIKICKKLLTIFISFDIMKIHPRKNFSKNLKNFEKSVDKK